MTRGCVFCYFEGLRRNYSDCHELFLVQDPCAGHRISVMEDCQCQNLLQNSTSSFSSLPELSRWDSTSCLSPTNSGSRTSPRYPSRDERSLRCLPTPPKRQKSWDGEDNDSVESEAEETMQVYRQQPTDRRATTSSHPPLQQQKGSEEPSPVNATAPPRRPTRKNSANFETLQNVMQALAIAELNEDGFSSSKSSYDFEELCCNTGESNGAFSQQPNLCITWQEQQCIDEKLQSRRFLLAEQKRRFDGKNNNKKHAHLDIKNDCYDNSSLKSTSVTHHSSKC